MRKKMTLYFLFLFILLNILGCAPLIIGSTMGALGAYAISKDTIQGDADKPYDSLWNSALTVSRIRGNIKQEDKQRGYIDLEAGSIRAWIRLIRLTRVITRLRISARKYHLPDLGFAQDMFIKITEEIK